MAMDPDPLSSDEIRRFEEQYRSQPESLVFARLADAYRKAGVSARALAVLEDGLRRHPDYPSGHIVRARTLRDLGRFDEATMSFRRVVELDGQNLVAVRELATLADASGDLSEARHWFERLLQLDPTHAEGRRRLAEIESSLGSTPPPDIPKEPPAPAEVATSDPTAWREEPLAPEGEPSQEEEDAIEAILNGDVPQTIRAEDTWWYEDQPSEKAAADAADDPDLLTRTMADLYAEQGLYREAADIYEELLQTTPNDQELRERLAGVVERGARGAPPPSMDRPNESGRAVDVEPLPGAGEPLAGRPAGPPVADELRRILRLGEERAAGLPDAEVSRDDVAKEPPLPAGPSEEFDSTAPADDFASEWLRGLQDES